MRHMGISGKTAIGAILAALALLVLTGITLNGTVLLWFVAAAGVAYVTCAAEIIRRGRNRTLAASGLGSILFIAFGIAYLRQWGLAFTSDPEALSRPVNSAYPDLYFFLAAGSGALTLLLLFAGAVLPGRGRGVRSPGAAARRRPATSARGPARASSPRTAGRPAAPRNASAAPAKRPAAPRSASGAKPAAQSQAKAKPRPVTRQPAKAATRR